MNASAADGTGVGPASRVGFAIALVGFLVVVPGGPTWTSGDASIALYLERTATAPLYGLLGTLAAYLPFGEPGFRVGILDAVLAAIAIAGVMRSARALLPKDPIAGIVAALLLAVAPGFREAAGPALLATAGCTWTLAFVIELARADESTPTSIGLAALGCTAIVVGSAPWLGLGLAIAVAAIAARTMPSTILAIALGAIGVTITALWSTAVGRLPGANPGLVALVDAGRGAGAVALGAGLLGIAFGAATRLPLASRVALVAGIAVVHAIVTGRDATSALAILTVGAAVIPVAVLRASGSTRRHLVVACAGIPLVGAAIAIGPTLAASDPGDAPSRLATDVIGQLPPGPGVIVPTRATVWTAINYEQTVSGARPDLALAPFTSTAPRDLFVADALRSDRIVGSDVPSFERIDPLRSLPRGRGFEMLAKPPALVASVLPPPTYATRTGEIEGTLLAIARGRYEAIHGRLDAAARAVGLAGTPTSRFRAADLAMLSTTAPSSVRPAMFAFIPSLEHPRPGPWMLDLFGDDLAWVAGLDGDLKRAPQAPRERKLHALWRQIWSGELAPDAPEIAALGPEALRATREMLETLKHPSIAERSGSKSSPTPTPAPTP